MGKSEKGPFFLFLAALGLGYAAAELHIDQLFSLAMALLAVAVIWSSLQTFHRGRLETLDRQSMRRESYSGISAYLIAGALMVIGIGLFFYSLWRALQPEAAAAWLESLADSPQGWALLLLAFGFFMFVFGLVRLIAGSAYQETRHRTALVELSFRAGGLISMVAGAALLAGGLWLLTR
jgi:hypothetical protein